GEIQLRITGSCPSGQAIAVVNADGTVGCQSASGGVTQVTASAPLVSSGGAAPNISLPNVIISGGNTAIGQLALTHNTSGFSNTASGFVALVSNTTGHRNTATGAATLQNNSQGFENTASGVNALNSNTTGYQNTATGVNVLLSNTSGHGNTASGVTAL